MLFWLAVVFNQELQPALKCMPMLPQTSNTYARAQLDACGASQLWCCCCYNCCTSSVQVRKTRGRTNTSHTICHFFEPRIIDLNCQKNRCSNCSQQQSSPPLHTNVLVICVACKSLTASRTRWRQQRSIPVCRR